MINFKTINSLFRYIIRSPKAGPPLRASLTLTNRCNLRCASCNVWERGTDFSQELKTKEIMDVLGQLIDAGVRIFYFFGGEPLLHPNFFKITNYLSRENGYFTETVTNGTIITPEVAKKIIDSGLNKIWVSIDGPEEIHDKLKGQIGCFKRAYQGLKLLCAEKDRQNSNILIDLAVTVSKLNYKFLPELIDLMKGLSLFEVNIRHMGVFFPEDIKNIEKTLNTDLGGKNAPLFSTGEDIILGPEDARELRIILRDLKAKEKEYNFRIHIEPSLMFVDDWRIGRTDTKTCFHLWTHLSINAEGKVNPCMWWDGYTVGDVRKTPILEIWNSPGFQNIRKNIKKLKACSKCTYFYLTLPENILRSLAVTNFPFKSLFKKT